MEKKSKSTEKKSIYSFTKGTQFIKMKSKFLRNLNGDNYMAIKCQNLFLASYLFSVEETITVKPTIKLQDSTQVLKLNTPINFEVTIEMIANVFIRIDFGDGKSTVYQASQLTAADLTANNLFKFTVSNVYKKGQDFTVKLFF